MKPGVHWTKSPKLKVNYNMHDLGLLFFSDDIYKSECELQQASRHPGIDKKCFGYWVDQGENLSGCTNEVKAYTVLFSDNSRDRQKLDNRIDDHHV